jgi:hypothetical protein
MIRGKTTFNSHMPKQTKGSSKELRFRIGVEYFDFLENIAETNRFGNSAGDVARRILEDGIVEYFRRGQESKSEHGEIKKRRTIR